MIPGAVAHNYSETTTTNRLPVLGEARTLISRFRCGRKLGQIMVQDGLAKRPARKAPRSRANQATRRSEAQKSMAWRRARSVPAMELWNFPGVSLSDARSFLARSRWDDPI